MKPSWKRNSLIYIVIIIAGLVLYTAGCGKQQARNEERKALMLKIFDEAWNKGNIDALEEMYADNYIRHELSIRPDIKGLEAFK